FSPFALRTTKPRHLRRLSDIQKWCCGDKTSPHSSRIGVISQQILDRSRACSILASMHAFLSMTIHLNETLYVVNFRWLLYRNYPKTWRDLQVKLLGRDISKAHKLHPRI